MRVGYLGVGYLSWELIIQEWVSYTGVALLSQEWWIVWEDKFHLQPPSLPPARSFTSHPSTRVKMQHEGPHQMLTPHSSTS